MTDSELKKFAASFRRGILGKRSSSMMCFAVCAPLEALLHMMYGVATELCESNVDHEEDEMNHFWIKLSDGRVLDPTADQFTELVLPKIYLGPPIPQLHSKLS